MGVLKAPAYYLIHAESLKKKLRQLDVAGAFVG
jgi:hypothetical protein